MTISKESHTEKLIKKEDSSGLLLYAQYYDFLEAMSRASHTKKLVEILPSSNSLFYIQPYGFLGETATQ